MVVAHRRGLVALLRYDVNLTVHVVGLFRKFFESAVFDALREAVMYTGGIHTLRYPLLAKIAQSRKDRCIIPVPGSIVDLERSYFT